MKRALAAILVVLATVVSPSLTSAAGVIDEQYSLESQKDKVGAIFEENIGTLRMPSLLYSYSQNKTSGLVVGSFCTGIKDLNCSNAEFMKYYALMPACMTTTEIDCIESIYAVKSASSARIEGIFKESIPEKVDHPYKADPDAGLPQGSVSGVWEIPNVVHGGGSTSFAAIVSRVGSLKRNGANWEPQPSGSDPWGYNHGDFSAAIYPINIVKDARYKANTSTINGQSTGINIGHPSQLPFQVCAIVGEGVCALRQTFPEDIQFGIVIRFSKIINGWMHGRIDSPQIEYKLTSYGTRVDMKGLSTRVPILAGWATPSDFSKSDLESKPYLNTTNGTLFNFDPSGNESMELFNIWSKLLKEKAAANPTEWSFYNIPTRDIASSNSCIKNSKTLAGFVTTNSTTYTATPPIYNEKTGTLDYKVASPHYLADGNIFQGKYNLYIDSKVARCIYKFSNAPISASVSVTSADGGQQSVATTVVNEQNGWLHLSAAGFTFSSPTLKVKLTQDANAVAPSPVAANDLPSQRASASVVKKSTITCVKGKIIKKVSAISPKCPVGYKKKA
jgi:hypothetical protein